MKHFISIVLYVSAFLPMFAVMWIKEVVSGVVDAVNDVCSSAANTPFGLSSVPEICKAMLDWYLLIEFIVFAFVFVVLCLMMKGNEKSAAKMVKVKNLKNRVAEYYLAYFSLFVLALIGFSLVDISDIISLFLLMLILGIVYIRNGMFYINPTVNLLKSFIYEIEFEEHSKTYSRVVISKEKLYAGETLNIYQSKYDFTIVKNKVKPSESENGANG
jgi:hypothetical protein